MHKSKTKWLCVDCNRNTQLEHYFVHNHIWFDLAKMPESGMLCINCLETRINRKLTSKDFTDAYINDFRRFPMSDLLRNRIAST